MPNMLYLNHLGLSKQTACTCIVDLTERLVNGRLRPLFVPQLCLKELEADNHGPDPLRSFQETTYGTWL